MAKKRNLWFAVIETGYQVVPVSIVRMIRLHKHDFFLVVDNEKSTHETKIKYFVPIFRIYKSKKAALKKAILLLRERLNTYKKPPKGRVDHLTFLLDLCQLELHKLNKFRQLEAERTFQRYEST